MSSTDPFAWKLIETFALVVWGGLCAGLLWEPAQRAGEALGRWLAEKLSEN